ncbi:DUF1129 domain-containing protein [Spiroplasma chrysopicola]|uniref:Transmembrane protein n=1 Tax=Spiroplasma chrysopicola DF-1 TaxID=1276227 RepID=R4UJ84_9MOLU|nr:hypothetical protein [Spiroplasma chrysopicola]AGM25376.1 hypothetical protein SCHRY_v1c08000 [Spiroplasma chrysopicola DF-1]
MQIKIKKIIINSDIFSFNFGFIGITFGLLSLLSLEPFWNSSNEVRDYQSFIFTILTIIFDTLSVISAMIAFIYGKKMYRLRQPNKKEKRWIDKRFEKLSYWFDFWSFIVGILGLIFGLISLVTLLPYTINEFVSWWATFTSIFLDTFSAIAAILALTCFLKSWKK